MCPDPGLPRHDPDPEGLSGDCRHLGPESPRPTFRVGRCLVGTLGSDKTGETESKRDRRRGGTRGWTGKSESSDEVQVLDHDVTQVGGPETITTPETDTIEDALED